MEARHCKSSQKSYDVRVQNPAGPRPGSLTHSLTHCIGVSEHSGRPWGLRWSRVFFSSWWGFRSFEFGLLAGGSGSRMRQVMRQGRVLMFEFCVGTHLTSHGLSTSGRVSLTHSTHSLMHSLTQTLAHSPQTRPAARILSPVQGSGGKLGGLVMLQLCSSLCIFPGSLPRPRNTGLCGIVGICPRSR